MDGSRGYLLPRIPLEIAGRYALVRGSAAEGHDGLTDEDEVGGSLSCLFAHHQLELQADYFRIAKDGDFAYGANEVRVQLQAAY